MLEILDLNSTADRAAFDACLDRLRATAGSSGEAADAVKAIVEDVRANGDSAVVKYMQKWTDPTFSADRIRVSQSELDAAVDALSPELREALECSIANVREYQQHVMPTEPAPVMIDGAELGMRFRPVASAGLAVPGGAAVLFSTIIMLAAPAQVAGVPRGSISVINPPPTRKADEPAGDISPIALATCRLLEIEKVYRIGGAQAIAALAFGTETVEPVDMIAGPGNIFVQLAKQQVAGTCGTDGGFYGPSEIVTIADETAKSARVASDLIAQAEHDPGKCFLVSHSRQVLEAITNEVRNQLEQRNRSEAIIKALENESAVILTNNLDESIEIADRIACEHVNLAVAEPNAVMDRMANGGEFFLGDQTPVAAGDYYAGPSHCLPTGTTARFTSGISVYTFLKRSGTVCYRDGMSEKTIRHIASLAEAEGLDAHANSARVRGEQC